MSTKLTPYDASLDRRLREMWSCICKLQQEEGAATPAPPTAKVGLTAKPGVATTYMRSDGAPALDQAIVPTWTGVHTFNAAVTINADLVASGSITFGDLTGAGTRMVVADPTGTLAVQAIPTGAAGANPTGTVGLATVNGAATTFMRSDAAPALSQAIAPTWTASHAFSAGLTANLTSNTIAVSASNNGIGAGTPPGLFQRVESGNGVVTGSTTPITPLILRNNYGANSIKVGQGINLQMQLQQASTVIEAFRIAVVATAVGGGSTEVQFWNVTSNSSQQFKTAKPGGQIQFNQYTAVGSFPGTAVGHLAFDATGNIITVAVPTGASPANPTASIGLATVNGSAATFMRSDAAPALDQAIAPTWSGFHTFSVVGTAGNAAGVGSVSLKSTNPVLELWNTAVASGDQKRWAFQIGASGGPIQLRTIQDDGTMASGGIAMQVFRNGGNVQDVQLVVVSGTPRIKITATATTILGENANPVQQATSIALTAAQSGSIIHNTGAAGSITYTLPAATVGLMYEFVNLGAQPLVIAANGAETIRRNDGITAANINSASSMDYCKLFCPVAGQWAIVGDPTGDWT